MEFDFDEYFKNYVYEPIDLCACYEPMFFPPDGFWDELHNPFSCTVTHKVGNTWYIVETECGGNESLTNIMRRLIFSEKGAVS